MKKLFYCRHSFIGTKEKNKLFSITKEYRFTEKRANEINKKFKDLYGTTDDCLILIEEESEETEESNKELEELEKLIEESEELTEETEEV